MTEDELIRRYGYPPFWDSIGEYKVKKYPFSFVRHGRDKEGDFGVRVLLHIPIGFLIGCTFPLSLPLTWLFIRYEENEDVHTQDQAWKDYFGALVGCVTGLVAEIAVIVAVL